MNSPDIVAKVCCAHAAHPSTCNICFAHIIVGDKDHEHFQWATKEGFKPLNMHGLCAKAWRAGTVAKPEQPGKPPATGEQDGKLQ